MLRAPTRPPFFKSLARRRSTGQGLAQRARIVLAAADGGHNGLIAERLGLCRSTVGTWRERFAAHRLDGLHDEPRPGAPRRIGDDAFADTIRRTLETRPPGDRRSGRVPAHRRDHRQPQPTTFSTTAPLTRTSDPTTSETPCQ